MATKGRPRKAKEKQTNALLEAVRFVSLAQNDQGTLAQTHCSLFGGWIAASNGVLTAGAKIDDGLDACPQTRRLLAALERAGEGFAITQLENGRLALKSGALRAVVPCVTPDDVPLTGPDANMVEIGEPFYNACKTIGHIATESGDRLHFVSLLLDGPFLTATNGAVIAQVYHRTDLPSNVILPKTAVAALLRAGKVPTGFGYTPNRSCTFHFADESWLKTQLFEGEWPDLAKVFAKEVPGYQNPIPANLFDALRLIGDFSDCNKVKFESNLLVTVNAASDVSSHDVKGLIEGPKFDIKNLELIAPIAKELSIPPANIGVAFFYGTDLRGAISYYVV